MVKRVLLKWVCQNQEKKLGIQWIRTLFTGSKVISIFIFNFFYYFKRKNQKLFIIIDEDKFGKKLMEKMGWKDGKGLGANENGMTDHIKVKFKMDNKGVGYNKNDYDNVWLDHQDDYEKILSSLSQSSDSKKTESADYDSQQEPQETNTENKQTVQSLEHKSKQSRARLHYKKFTRSKDLSNATNDDLNCILGHKKRSEINKENDKVANQTSTMEEDNSSQDSFRVSFNLNRKETKEVGGDSNAENNGLQFSTNKLSIHDYFKIKMEEKKNSVKTTVTKSEIDDRLAEPEFDHKQIDKYDETDENFSGERKKKKKKSKRDFVETAEVAEEEIENEEEQTGPPQKKKKSKKPKELNEEAVEQAEEEAKSKEISNTLVFDEVETIKKKSKKSKKENEEDNSEIEKTITLNAELTTKIIEEVVELDDNKVQINAIKNKKQLEKNMLTAFKGSNVFNIHGYSSYIVNNSIEDALKEKAKKAHKKRIVLEKNLQIDANFYKNSKKKTC